MKREEAQPWLWGEFRLIYRFYHTSVLRCLRRPVLYENHSYQLRVVFPYLSSSLHNVLPRFYPSRPTMWWAQLVCMARFYSEKEPGVIWVLQCSSWVSKGWVPRWRSPGWEGSSGLEEEDISVSLWLRDFSSTNFCPLPIASSPTLSSTMPYNYTILCMQSKTCQWTQGSGLSSGWQPRWMAILYLMDGHRREVWALPPHERQETCNNR